MADGPDISSQFQLGFSEGTALCDNIILENGLFVPRAKRDCK